MVLQTCHKCSRCFLLFNTPLPCSTHSGTSLCLLPPSLLPRESPRFTSELASHGGFPVNPRSCRWQTHLTDRETEALLEEAARYRVGPTHLPIALVIQRAIQVPGSVSARNSLDLRFLLRASWGKPEEPPSPQWTLKHLLFDLTQYPSTLPCFLRLHPFSSHC